MAMLMQAPSAVADQAPVMFPAEQFGRASLNLPQSTIHLENVLGKNANFERLIDYSTTDRFRVLSNPVGRLDLLVQSNGRLGVITCTASIISHDHVLTNNHCAPGANDTDRIKKALLLMNFYGDDTEDAVDRYDLDLNPVEQDASLDYAIYKVIGDPSARYGSITLNPRDPEPGESLVIIHHPAGLAKHLTRGGCRAVSPRAIRDTDILHRCDTLPGSSGSPIFASRSGQVIGLHYAGASTPTLASYNYGKRLARIARKSAIIGTILREAEEAEKRQAALTKLKLERERRRREADLRARIEKELRDKMEGDLKARLAAVDPAGRAGEPASPATLFPPFAGEHYPLADISVPLPEGSWHRMFIFRSDGNRRGVELEFRGLADIRDGRVRRILVAVTNTGGRDSLWSGRNSSYCKNDNARTYFSLFDIADPKRSVCWRLRKFRWPIYDGKVGPDGMKDVRGLRNKIAYFLTRQNENAWFYGFTFHVSVGGQYVRAIYAFNNEFFGFDEKICCGDEAAMEPVVRAAADQIVQALQRTLERETVDYAAVRNAFAEIK